MQRPFKKWLITPPQREMPFLNKYDLPKVAGPLLEKRGIYNEENLKSFLNPRISALPDPNLLPDMEKAAKILAEAIEEKKSIVIFGDYDADGVTSTALLYSFLAYTKSRVSWYIPHRIDEGYGLNCPAMRKLADEGTDLIVTVDCGSNSPEEVELAKDLGMTVIVTDHHPIMDKAAPAAALVNPARADNHFPDANLAGVGVAFHLVAATRRELRQRGFWAKGLPEFPLKELLDLVAIGTIADVVPLTNVNRILVTHGLLQAGTGERLGLNELIDVAGAALPLTSGEVSFKLAPRINAHGRLWRADEGVKLLLTKDERLAKLLALQLDTANNQRKATEKEVINECRTLLEENPNWLDKQLLVLGSPKWHPGVVGIVAGRLMEEFGKPAIVIGRDGKGSGRSLGGIDLSALLTKAGELLETYGGHPLAAGLKINFNNIDALRERLNNILEQEAQPETVQTLAIDAEITLDELGEELLLFLEKLEPCGMANGNPVFVTYNVPVRQIYTIGQEHIKLIIDHPAVKEALGYKMAAEHHPIGPCRADIAYTIAYSTYRGHKEMYLKIEDIDWKSAE